jgi:hypothetical protein
MLAADPKVFSRFIISANRISAAGIPITGEKALACGGLSAFLGFACPAFSQHDYFLGRANCQTFLRSSFGVPLNNPCVAGQWTPPQITGNSFTVNGQTYVRLIPLLGPVAMDEMTATWPVGMLRPSDYYDAIKARWQALVESEIGKGWFRQCAGWLAGTLSKRCAAHYAIKKMQQALTEWKL